MEEQICPHENTFGEYGHNYCIDCGKDLNDHKKNIVTIDFSTITRFEFIDDNGRAVVRYLKPNERFSPSIQDGYRTLKIFIQNS